MIYKPKIINDDFYRKGFFSEYLPPCFCLNSRGVNVLTDIPISHGNDYIDAYKYTMSRFADSVSRRTIFIPDFAAYVAVIKYMIDRDILKELVFFSSRGTHSFSKIVQADGKLTKHEQAYDLARLGTPEGDEFIQSTYIPNVVKKINKAKGAIGVLSLDIANFYGSIYTHYIPAIVLDYEEGLRQYKLSLIDAQDPSITNEFKRYQELDVKVRTLNSGRTNGLLAGTMISQILAEALLTRIDLELESKGIRFVRYSDDYEVFIYDIKEIDRVVTTISQLLSRYQLTLNNEKTKYQPFPYYAIHNLEKIIQNFTVKKLEDVDLIELFNAFFNMEKHGTKGAIRYLIKSMNNEIDIANYDLYASYLLNVLVNDSRSLIKVCELFIRNEYKFHIGTDHFQVIINLLHQYISEEKELEVVWLIYLLKKLDFKNFEQNTISRIIKSNNELAIIILIKEFKKKLILENIESIKTSAQGWLLIYELFRDNYITKAEFSIKSGIKKNLGFYARLKRERFSFYKKIYKNRLK